MTLTQVIATTIVDLAYVAAGAYAWHRWINYLTERLHHVGADPIPGIPIGAKADGRE